MDSQHSSMQSASHAATPNRNQVARPHQSGSRPAIQPRPHPSSSRSSEPNMPYKLVGQKFFRINGVCEKNHQLDYPTPPSDPRSRFPRDSQVKDLPVPQFTIDDFYVGIPPRREVFIDKLNDNVSETFLLREAQKLFGAEELIESLKIFFHPTTKRHLGFALVVLKTAKAAMECKQHFHERQLMGIPLFCSLDPFAAQADRVYLEKTKSRLPPPTHLQGVNPARLIEWQYRVFPRPVSPKPEIVPVVPGPSVHSTTPPVPVPAPLNPIDFPSHGEVSPPQTTPLPGSYTPPPRPENRSASYVTPTFDERAGRHRNSRVSSRMSHGSRQSRRSRSSSRSSRSSHGHSRSRGRHSPRHSRRSSKERRSRSQSGSQRRRSSSKRHERYQRRERSSSSSSPTSETSSSSHRASKYVKVKKEKRYYSQAEKGGRSKEVVETTIRTVTTYRVKDEHSTDEEMRRRVRAKGHRWSSSSDSESPDRRKSRKREVKRRSDENRSRERSRDISLSTAPPPTIAPSPQRVALSGTIPVPPSIPPLLPPSLFQTPPPPPRMVPPIFGSPPLSVPCLTQPTLLRPGEVPRPVGLPQPIIISPMVRLTITEEPSKDRSVGCASRTPDRRNHSLRFPKVEVTPLQSPLKGASGPPTEIEDPSKRLLSRMSRTIELVESAFIEEESSAIAKDLLSRQGALLFDHVKMWKENVKEQSLAQLVENNRDTEKPAPSLLSTENFRSDAFASDGFPSFIQVQMPKMPSFRRKLLPPSTRSGESSQAASRSPSPSSVSSSSTSAVAKLATTSTESTRSSTPIRRKRTRIHSSSSSSSSLSQDSEDDEEENDREEDDPLETAKDDKNEITLDNNFDDNKACKLETSEDVVVMPIDDGTLANRDESAVSLDIAVPPKAISPIVEEDPLLHKEVMTAHVYHAHLHDHCYPRDLQAPVAPPKKRPKKNNELLALLPPVDARKEIPRRKVSFKQRTEEEELALRNRYKISGFTKDEKKYICAVYKKMCENGDVGLPYQIPALELQIPDVPQLPKPRREGRAEYFFDDEELEGVVPHSQGCARAQGYYKVANKQKRGVVRRPEGFQDRTVITEREQNAVHWQLQRSKEQRSLNRRLLSSLDTNSDFFKENQLKYRKKSIKFARSRIHGWGLYAMEPIAADEMIVEYVGEMVRHSVADEREKRYERRGIGSSYLFRIDADNVIDATKKGNFARFINHSCSPNCYAKVVTVDGTSRIVIYSKTLINAGDEITYDYKFPIEDDKIDCLCGAPNCRGTLN